MNYTQNHHLPQWVKSDRIMMDDFNQMCKDLESSLTTAQSTANAAKSAAAAAKAAADQAQITANTPLYAVGSYRGNNGSQTITIGFRPSFVFINGILEFPASTAVGEFSDFCCATTGNTVSRHIVFTSSGFTVHNMPEGEGKPWLSQTGRVYDFIAFR